MIIKKLFEIKINNGKTEPESCDRTSLQTVTVFMYSILFLNFKCSEVFVQVGFVVCGNLTRAWKVLKT